MRDGMGTQRSQKRKGRKEWEMAVCQNPLWVPCLFGPQMNANERDMLVTGGA